MIGPRTCSGIYLESTGDEGYGVLPGEDRLVKDVMSRSVISVDASISVKDAAETMCIRDVQALIVYRGKHLVGLLHEHDVAVYGMGKSKDPGSVAIQDIMTTHEPITCREDAILADAARAMADHHLQSIPVVTAAGVVVGLLSLVEAAGAVMPSAAAVWLAKLRPAVRTAAKKTAATLHFREHVRRKRSTKR